MKAKKTFLRRGTGTVNQRNKWRVEQQKREERRRAKQLGILQTKPKTQKILLMEQWREKIKSQEKMARKKKEQNPSNQPPNGQIPGTGNHTLPVINKSVNSNYLRNTKSFESNAKSKMKLLKSRGKLSRSNGRRPITAHKFEEKAPCDELQCASKFEELQIEDTVLVKEPLAEPEPLEFTEMAPDGERKEEEQSEENPEIGVWTKPKPKKMDRTTRQQKGYNFARHTTLLSRQKKAAHPNYSHHHHTSIYGQNQNAKRRSATNSNLEHFHKPKRKMSETKRMFHKAATVHTMSKRDRLAANYVDRKANEPQIEAQKAALQRADELEAVIANYEQKCHDAQVMKQSSLDSFRKYQALITETQSQLEQKQRDFEKYKKKQERILCQKTQELDKRSRALLNVPDRKQRTQIELIKAQNEEIKQEFAEKEKRYKSKIERLKRQNKKLRAEKMEIQSELKKIEKERIEHWIKKQDDRSHDPLVTVKRERVSGSNAINAVHEQHHLQQHIPHRAVSRKKKKYSISKIDANRPKTQQTPVMIKRENINDVVHRSTNDIRSTMTSNRANMMNSQSMNAVRVNMHYDEYRDAECNHDDVSSSSESCSSSEGSVQNGEDMQCPEVVIISNRSKMNGKKRHQNNVEMVVSDSEQKETEKEIEANPTTNHLPEVPPEFDPSKMTAEQYESESVINRQNAVQRMQHPDGKMEQIYGDGSKLILFPNGTEKYIFGNLSHKKHKQIFVKFPNGDIKKILSDGVEVYFYAQNNIIHATKPEGVELFYFESQHEIHFGDNTKHILFADGTKKYIYPNGEEQCVFPNQ